MSGHQHHAQLRWLGSQITRVPSFHLPSNVFQICAIYMCTRSVTQIFTYLFQRVRFQGQQDCWSDKYILEYNNTIKSIPMVKHYNILHQPGQRDIFMLFELRISSAQLHHGFANESLWVCTMNQASISIRPAVPIGYAAAIHMNEMILLF
jgi:hypothetical protein